MNDSTHRIALVLLGLVALAVIVGSIVLSNNDKSLNDALLAMGGAAVGAIAGLVSPRPSA